MATAPLQLGRYEALGLIAQGGMAKVYLGRARGVGGFQRKVAIKVMHPHIAAEPQFVSMFLDEARLAAMIHHPNVVSTLDIHDSPEQGLSLVMEYIQGASLDRIIEVHRHKTGRPLPIAVSLRILLDALAGLHAAHELTDEDGNPLAVVHRDVSPQNILVGTDGIARITDFGVARAEARISSTREGMVKGKLVYMAIEQLKAQPVDRRTDVYAAGVVLWELLAGRQLFVGDSQAALVHAVLMGPEAMPSDLNDEVPAEIDVVCMRALLPDPAQRYPSAAALAEALRQGAAAAGLAPASSAEVAALARAAHLPPKPLADDARASGLDLRTPRFGDAEAMTQRTPGGFSGPDTGTVKMGSDELAPAFDPAPAETLTRPLVSSGAVPAISEQTEALASPVPMPVPHTPVSTTTSGSIAAIAAHRRPSSAPVIVAAVSLVAFVVAGLAFLMSSPSDSASLSPPSAAAGSAPPAPEPIAAEAADAPEPPAEPGATVAPAETAAAGAAPSAPRPAPAPRWRPPPAPAPLPKKPDVGFDPLRP